MDKPSETDQKYLSEVKEIFTAEAREHLENLESLILNFEKLNEDPGKTIDQLFRIVHTLKGGAYAADFKAIGNLAHEMETVLALTREKKVVFNDTLTSLLLSSIDLVISMVNTPDFGESFDNVKHINAYRKIISGSNENRNPIEGRKNQSLKFLDENGKKKASKKYPSKKSRKSRYGTISYINKPEKFIFSEFALDSNIENLNFFQIQIFSDHILKYGSSIKASIDEISNVIVPIQCFQNGTKKSTIDLNQLSKNFDSTTILAGCNFNEKDISKHLDLKKYLISKIDPQLVLSHSNSELLSAGEPKQKVIPPLENNSGGTAASDSGQSAPASPISRTVRIKVEILDKLMRLASELVLVRNQQLRNVDKNDDESRTSTQRLDIITTEIQSQIMATRMQPIGSIFTKSHRIVRDLSLQLDKNIELVTHGNDVELDKTILETLADPIMHLVRNCCDHGIENKSRRAFLNKPEVGKIYIRAFHEGGLINIEIQDDGSGISMDRVKNKIISNKLKTPDELGKMSNQDIMQMIFQPGFSTASQVTDVSGRGVGMDVVKVGIEKMGGTIDIKSLEKVGTEFFLRLPLTLAIIPCLIISCRKQIFAIPQVNLEELIGLSAYEASEKIEYAGNREVYRVRDSLLPIIRLSEVISRKKPFDNQTFFEIMNKYSQNKSSISLNDKDNLFYLAVLKAGYRKFGLIVDSILGTEEVVVSPMHSALKDIQIYSGATVRGDGQVSLIIDAFGLSEFSGIFNTIGDSQDQKNSHLYQKIKQPLHQSVEDSLLLFRQGSKSKELFAVKQREVSRVTKIFTDDIKTIGNSKFISINNESTMIMFLNDYISIPSHLEKDEVYFIIPKNTKFPIGIYATYIMDLNNYKIEKMEKLCIKPGIVGSSVINGEMMVHLDLQYLIKKCEAMAFNSQKASEISSQEVS